MRLASKLGEEMVNKMEKEKVTSKLGKEMVGSKPGQEKVKGSWGTGSEVTHITYCSLQMRKQEIFGGKMELIHSGGCSSN